MLVRNQGCFSNLVLVAEGDVQVVGGTSSILVHRETCQKKETDLSYSRTKTFFGIFFDFFNQAESLTSTENVVNNRLIRNPADTDR